jgi:starch synthase
MLGLPEKDVPIIAMISRLVSHKGLELVKTVAEDILHEDIQFVLLGTGDAAYEDYFREIGRNYEGKASINIAFNGDLSRKIYSGADIFLMPSVSEPCGLSQMIASRYGVIPVTRETGGLYDSIKGYWEDGGKIMGNGFTFANYSSSELWDRTVAAIDLWQNHDKRKKLVGKIMRTDFSWTSSAIQYIEMYDSL